MTQKLLSPGELTQVLASVTCAGIDADDGSHGARLRAHIAALEAAYAALLERVNDALNYVHMHSPDMGGNHRHTFTSGHGRAVARLQAIAADPHPGAAFLSEYAKALERARNEGRTLGHGDAVGWLREHHGGVLRPTAADLSAHLHGVRSGYLEKETEP